MDWARAWIVAASLVALALGIYAVGIHVGTMFGFKGGGMLGEARADRIDALRRYGRSIGLAFQVADDTLDYNADGERLGKTLGQDLRQGKATLPLLHLLGFAVVGGLLYWLANVIAFEKLPKDIATNPKYMKGYGE